ncbi:hypothetical protein EKO23_15605 [Nocardioides guangzhouensis]|uniref:Uncharacterized protein n=1 Tax=Nocardioides guangzhouensis TaxID=2497878 RepID=A0A4Q4Z967_9ACTN|nr:hypothetical protein [Nocardioides guangzhouensis]RYP84447.1 hypothetical protein EKO23_15605 [Nocardioides guangzhouensis]
MSDLGYMIWFLATGLMVIVVLVVGTMKAADLFPGRDEKTDGAEPEPVPHPARTDEARDEARDEASGEDSTTPTALSTSTPHEPPPGPRP